MFSNLKIKIIPFYFRVIRPYSPLKNGARIINLSERDSVVFPRIVTLIRNGTKPRKVFSC